MLRSGRGPLGFLSDLGSQIFLRIYRFYSQSYGHYNFLISQWLCVVEIEHCYRKGRWSKFLGLAEDPLAFYLI
jgi:hypothetical protein